MGSVIVYGREGCYQCKATVKALDKSHIPHEYKHIDEAPESHRAGVASLPIVVAGEQKWGGFRPDRIKELAETPKQVMRSE
ncbi:glutaredoxin [Mycobacterium phage Indlulamithi]|uniref:Glutaredoxin n=1 Tax=Mycobacterium phage Indlulamithi TaxID=2656582 RepID=A0A649VCL5_9CAUD|nr:glutaredoxin [Mycobacterium phage Indlulamithi]QGJ90078.1 glutaredoxin [Mycobacterium phage Indlulamithi]